MRFQAAILVQSYFLITPLLCPHAMRPQAYIVLGSMKIGKIGELTCKAAPAHMILLTKETKCSKREYNFNNRLGDNFQDCWEAKCTSIGLLVLLTHVMISLQDYQISDTHANYIFSENLYIILVFEQRETFQIDPPKLQNNYNNSNSVDSKTTVTGLIQLATGR